MHHPCCCVGGYYPPFPTSYAPAFPFCDCPDSVPPAWDVTISDMVSFFCDCSALEATYRLTLSDECWICDEYLVCSTASVCWLLEGDFGCGFDRLGLRACCYGTGSSVRLGWALSFCDGNNARGFNWLGASGPPFTATCFPTMQFVNGSQALFFAPCNPGGVADLVPVWS